MKRRVLAGLIAAVAGITTLVGAGAPASSATTLQTVTIGSDATWTVDGGPGTTEIVDCANPWGWFNNPAFLPGQPMWDRSCPLTGNVSPADYEHRLFSKTLTVPGIVQSAQLIYSIDNVGFASINGQQVGSITDWGNPVNMDVTALVHTGSNTVVIDATDRGGIAATVLRLTVTYTPANVAETKDDCKKGGWANVTRPDGSSFENQGDCVSYVASRGRSDAR